MLMAAKGAVVLYLSTITSEDQGDWHMQEQGLGQQDSPTTWCTCMLQVNYKTMASYRRTAVEYLELYAAGKLPLLTL